MPPVATLPRRCPAGHTLAPGEVSLGWHPCLCAGAKRLGRGGHTTIRCAACLDAGSRTVVYDPACWGEMHSDRWQQVSLPRSRALGALSGACFALGALGGVIADAPPIARRAIGRDTREVAAFYAGLGAVFAPLPGMVGHGC